MKKGFLLMFLMAFALFAKAADGNHWQFNVNAENTMTCTAVLYIDGVSMQNDANAQAYEIGAFIGEECVSSYIPDAFPTLPFVSGYGYNFMFHSNSSTGTITFRVYNHLTGQEMECTHNCPTTLAFVKDGNQGNLANLFHIELFADPTIICYDIDATASPVAGGTVSGAGTYRPGRTCKLTATANTGYDFVNWTLGGSAVSTNAVYSFTVSADAEYVANFQIKTYAITATADPSAGGIVTGSGTYNYGSTCTLTATPAAGYLFTNWTKGGVEVSTDATYSFTATEGVEGTYVAHFSLIPYEITASANPAEGGTVNVAGALTYGSTCTLTATPAEHYNFVNWTLGGEVVSTDAEYEFTVTGDAAYVANFELASYAITATANPTVGGTVDGAGTVTYGQSCTLTATANGGYQFVNWTLAGAVVSTNASYTFTVTAAGDYVANFAPKTYSVTVAANPAEGGFVSIKPETGPYSYGQQIKLRAVPKVGYEFVNWTKDSAKGMQKDGDEVLVYTLDGTETGGTNGYATESEITQNGMTWMVMGNTDINPWRIGGKSLNGVDRPVYSTGTISDNISKIDITHGTNNGVTVNSMTLIVSANSDFSNPTSTLIGTYEASTTTTFNRPDGVSWAGKYYKLVYNVSVSGGSNKYMQFVSAEFYKDNNGGGVTPTPINMDEPEITFNVNDDNEGAYTANFQAVALPPVPTQTHWTVEGGYGNSMIITGIMNLDEASMKDNEICQYLEIGAFVGTECRGSYLPTLYDLPFAQGYFYEMVIFSNASSGEQIVFKVYSHITDEELDVTCLTNDTFVADANLGDLMTPHVLAFETNLTAHYNIVAEANIPEAGNVTGSGSYEEDTQCTLTATANYGYNFVNWTLNDNEVSTNTTYVFTVTDAGTYIANFAPIDYTITIENYEHGTVTGAGTYAYNTQCALTATPDEGYHFVSWTKAGAVVSTDASYAFTVTEDETFDAVFAINTYSIVATASPDAGISGAGGTVTGAGTYDHFATCTLTATPVNAKWIFENWTENDEVVEGAEAEYSFEVTGPRNLVANFAPIFTIEASVDADIFVDEVEVGTVEGAGNIIKGRDWELTATANTGYTFSNWFEVIGDERIDYSTEATISENAQADREFVAFFTLNSYDIEATVNPTELPATATEITVAGEVQGTGTYYHYATCTLTAVPSTGYHFVSWTENDEVVEGAEAEYSFEVAGPRNLVANFELDTHEITATVVDVTTDIPEAAPAVPGTVTGTGTYNYYDMCTVVATPEIGYHFVNWTENDVEVATTESYEFMVEGDRALVANFELDTHDITVTIVDVTVDKPAAAPDVPGIVTGDGTYNYYATCTMVATPATGYHFVNWTENDVEVSTEATYEFMVTEDRALVANFELDTHTIALSVADVTAVIPEAAPAIPGTVTGEGTYNYYAMCTVVATPALGYHFVNWTENDVEVATTATYEFMVEGDRTLVANFELDTHDIAVTIVDVTVDKPAAAPDVPGTVTGDGTYNYYATCTMIATPATGYHFVNWTENDVEVSTETTYEFMVTEDRALVANFELDTHTIALSVADVTAVIPEAAPAIPGTVTGEGTYNYYAMCTVVATPALGYHFVNWTENGTEVATTATYEFMVEGDRALVANFELNVYEVAGEINPAVTPDNDPDPAGVITGTGSYNHYAVCELTATANTGYTFVNWTLNGVEVSTEATFSFQVSGDVTYTANFELNSYPIVVLVDPTDSGTIYLEGNPDPFVAANFYHFDDITLIPQPATGYHFVNWTDEFGEEIEVENVNLSFMVEGARNIIANFELNTYEIVTEISPAETPDNDPDPAGVVTGAGTYAHFSTCELTATANTGYTFVNWTLNGEVVSTEATYSFEVSGPATYVANFEINSYTIAATENPTGYGSIEGAGSYTHFSTCTLVATASEGHTFFNWTENDVEIATTPTYSFTVTGPRSLVAHFINRYEITVAANPTAGGTVTGAGIYDEGTEVTLTATVNTGYHFVNWTLNGNEVSTNTTYTFTALAAGEYVANFELNSYDITATANPTEGGTISGTGTYNHFETCTLVATASQVYLFVNWTRNGEVVSTDPTLTFTVTEAADFVANFIYNNYEVTAIASPSYAGVVTGTGTYYHTQSCTLTATANTGYVFLNWTLNGEIISTNTTYTFSVTSSGTYVANFAARQYTVVLAASPSFGGTVSGGGTFYYGQTCVVNAVPNFGYHFANWTNDDGEIVSTNVTYMFNVESHQLLTAHFALDTFVITAVANPGAGGIVTGSGTYEYGLPCVLTATATTGYEFVNWTKNGDEVSTEPTYTFTVTEAGTYVAHFALLSYEITAVANPEEGGTVEGAGTYNFGESCTLTATANTGYTFVNWTMGNEVVSTNASYTFTVNENADYVANFEEIIIPTYEVTVTASPENYGTVEGGGVYEEGETCTITATPSTGHIFVHWTENGEVVSENAEYTFLVTADHDFVAVFDVDGVGEYSNLVFNIYPNPATEKVVVESNEFIRRCEVYSVNGALMVTMYECTETFEINVSEYAPGSYVIRLISDSSVQTRRFIKK